MYEPPRLSTFQDQKRARERAVALPPTQQAQPSIDRWAIRQDTPPDNGAETGSGLLGHMQSSDILRSGTGVPLAPLTFPADDGRTSGRKPLPMPMPRRERTHSPTPEVDGRVPPFEINSSSNLPILHHPCPPGVLESHSPMNPGFPGSTLASTRIRNPQSGSRSRPLPQPIPRSGSRGASSDGHTHTIPPALPLGIFPTSAPARRPEPPMIRSDTVTSVKSLDRFEMTPHGARPLPRPPNGLGPSRSLDRGIVDVGKEAEMGLENQARRRLVKRSSRSTIVEEERGNSSNSGRGEELASDRGNTPAGMPSFTFTDDDTGVDADTGSRVMETAPSISIEAEHGISFPTFSLPDPDSAIDLADTVRNRPASREFSDCIRSSHAGPGVFCAACDRVILGKVLTAMRGRWHPDCFRCSACQMLLEHVSSYEHEGSAYCHMDYHDKFAPKCYHCGTAIVDSRFVTIDDPDPNLPVRYYHELHFFCGECGDPFLDPSKSSAAGTEASRGAVDEAEVETKDFVLEGKHAFCVECDIKLHKPKCRSCRNPIREDAVETMGLKWHRDCFRCAQCHGPFANNCFFPQDGKAFCQDCFVG